MAGSITGVKKPMTVSVRREDRRRIPLTAFTLLTVREESMLSTYLQSKESVDVSFEKRMASASLDKSSSLGSLSKSSQAFLESRSSPGDSPCNDDKAMKRAQAVDLELDLDKFMASITASESPNAVIYTIMATKPSRPARK